MKLLITFVILNVVNVILQTVKSIATVKCGKWGASLINAIAYGLYTVVLVYTNLDFPLWEKVIVVGAANLVGVFVVKFLEEKARKDKVWEIKATVHSEVADEFVAAVKSANIPHNFINAGKYVIVNCYCNTQTESEIIKPILEMYNVKYFVSETKRYKEG